MKRILILLLFIILSLQILSARDHNKPWYPVNDYTSNTRADSLHGFDMLRYTVNLHIDHQENFIDGSVSAVVYAEEDLSQINYELEQLNVTSVIVNGDSIDFSYDNSIITIPLSNIYAGQEFTTTVFYNGYPVHSNDAYNIGMIFRNDHIFTLSDPSGVRWWMPAYDNPWDKAEIDFDIRIRSDWLVACNGIRTGITDNNDGTRTHHWVGSNPMAPHLFSITAGNYVEINQSFDEIPVMNFVPQNIYNNAINDLAALPSMMQIYSDRYGYYPFEKYGNAVVNMQTFGAMEHQTMTTLGSAFIDGNQGGKYTIAHELSHQWFGNCVTPLTWADVWLSEGFATYSEAIYAEALYGYQGMIEYTRTLIQNYYVNWMNSYGIRTIYDPPFNEFFAPPVYEKAASVLHALRSQVGSDNFFEILQTFIQTHYNQNVVTAEFIEVAEQISGQDLSQFFQQWIFSPGLPYLDFAVFKSEATDQIKIYAKTSSNSNTDFYQKFPVLVNYLSYHDSLSIDASPQLSINYLDYNPEFYQGLELDPDNWIINLSKTSHVPCISSAYAANNNVIVYWDNYWEDVEINGYDIYRANSSYGEYSKINDTLIEENYFIDDNVVDGNTYFYKIVTVDTEDFISDFSEPVEATPISLPLNQGILVIDETRNGNGNPGNPDDDMVDDFYNEVIPANITNYDYDEMGVPSLDLLGQYSTVIWHDDDFSFHYLNNSVNDLGCYYIGGGNLIISGWKTAQSLPEHFFRNFLNTQESFIVMQNDFTSAYSETYPILHTEPDKILATWNGTLPMITIFPENNQSLYSFQGTPESEYNGESCSIVQSEFGNIVFLGFPLYYMQEYSVRQFFQQILDEFGEVLGTPNNEIVTPSIDLNVYPNPFGNSADRGEFYANISFKNPVEGLVEIEIFNVLGQRVKIIENKIFPQGMHLTRWDGRDNKDKVVSNGIYFVKITSGKHTSARKVMFIR
ncbi:MAG: M1 family aminopeptidase [Candidatus Cloacimonetes bacterium]|nr:M1 family aminopeptidase [Candidatus Cloacimonadota bacterium]